jgi:hypothetical protein
MSIVPFAAEDGRMKAIRIAYTGKSISAEGKAVRVTAFREAAPHGEQDVV